MWWKISLLLAVGAVVALVAGGYWLGSRSAGMPPLVRSRPVALPPCGEKPNCVSSLGDPVDVEHYFRPVVVMENPIPRLASIMQGEGYVVHVLETDYLYGAQASLLFGFVDDIEFLFDPAAGLLHIRSASRVGYSDLGANRRRVERLLDLLGGL